MRPQAVSTDPIFGFYSAQVINTQEIAAEIGAHAGSLRLEVSSIPYSKVLRRSKWEVPHTKLNRCWLGTLAESIISFPIVPKSSAPNPALIASHRFFACSSILISWGELQRFNYHVVKRYCKCIWSFTKSNALLGLLFTTLVGLKKKQCQLTLAVEHDSCLHIPKWFPLLNRSMSSVEHKTEGPAELTSEDTRGSNSRISIN